MSAVCVCVVRVPTWCACAAAASAMAAWYGMGRPAWNASGPATGGRFDPNGGGSMYPAVAARDSSKCTCVVRESESEERESPGGTWGCREEKRDRCPGCWVE